MVIRRYLVYEREDEVAVARSKLSDEVPPSKNETSYLAIGSASPLVVFITQRS